MKIYRIKINNCYYVKGFMFGGNPFLQIMPTFEQEDAGWFEEDKAIKYCEDLNKTYNPTGLKFKLELVKESDK